jgi:choline dehydrogenase-like flavoprotein
MRIARDIVGQSAMRPLVSHEMSPGNGVETDEQWLQFARQNGQTIYHPVGTCSMGTGPQAVVDDRLRVHGIEGLRVIDASIMPTQISGNTMAAVLMIAEKGAAMIREDRAA